MLFSADKVLPHDIPYGIVYDDRGNCVSYKTPAGERWELNEYDANGRLITHRLPDITSVWEYNDFGHVERQLKDIDGGKYWSAYHYDPDGNKLLYYNSKGRIEFWSIDNDGMNVLAGIQLSSSCDFHNMPKFTLSI